jgi:hypothetical protein
VKPFMPTALERLLASPSALRTLRAIVNTPGLSSTCLPTVDCCHSATHHRNYSSKQDKPKYLRIYKYVALENGKFQTLGKKAIKPPAIDRESNANDGELYNSRWLRIDNAAEEHKASIWAEMLQYRERVYGLRGISEIFFGMARRGYNLPTADTPDAEVLWSTFLRHPDLAIPVIDHAANLYRMDGHIYPHLYEKCMAYWLPRRPKQALDYHHKMILKLRLRRLPLCKLARIALSSSQTEPLDALMDMYRTSNERNIYDEIVPVLCDRGNITLARQWHTLCSHRKDLPSPSAASHPVVRLFRAESSTILGADNRESGPQDRGTIAKRLPLTTNAPRHRRNDRYNEDLMRRLQGRDTAPVRFDDAFCARLFATRAVAPATIIQGLVMVGVNEIGPQALRTMGLRSEAVEELPDRFRELKEAGIALKGSVFSLALEQFALAGRFNLVRSILDSDQHPDVFGDPEMQKKLLDFYIQQEDWVQAHRTLAVLSLFHNDSISESWNLLLQARIRQLNPPQLMQVLQDMRASNIFVTEESMTAIRSILRRRQRGRKPGVPIRSRFDDVRFVTRVYMFILESGIGPVWPISWREIIRRLGMLGRFRELRRLTLWLLSWYAIRDGTAFAKLPKPHYLDAATAKLRRRYGAGNSYYNVPSWKAEFTLRDPVRQLFPASFQQALIVWGFRAGLLPNAHLEQSMLSPIPSKRHHRRRLLRKGVIGRLEWSEGLRMLVQLRDLGVLVHPHTVAKALQMQFIVLFGRGRSNKRQNRIMEDVNDISYHEYIREANRIWGEPLFTEPHMYGTSRLHGVSWHPRLPRMQRRTWLGLDQVLGSDWRNTSQQESQVLKEPDEVQDKVVGEVDLGTNTESAGAIPVADHGTVDQLQMAGGK